jgi:hypothetical protein
MREFVINGFDPRTGGAGKLFRSMPAVYMTDDGQGGINEWYGASSLHRRDEIHRSWP